MYGDLETLESYWKSLDYDLTSADKKVCNGPCFVYAAHLVANSSGVGTAIIRDGHDASGAAVVSLSSLTSSNDPRKFDPPLYFKKGVFVDVVANVSSILIHFLPARDKKE
jgi:hypothetical protein